MSIRVKIPEETSYARLTMPKGDVKKQIIEYIIKNRNNTNLGFEFTYNNKISPVYLIGKESEENIPLVKYPMVLEFNGMSYVVSNLMGSIKSELTDGSLIKSKRSDYVDFETMRNVLVYSTLANQDIDMIASYTAQIATIWVTKTIKNYLRLDPNTESDVEAALFIYFIRRYIADVSNDSILKMMNNYLNAKWKTAYDTINVVLTRLEGIELDMGAYIRTIANEHPATVKLETVTINSFISNNWYSGSDSSNIQIYIATENIHTMASIFYHAEQTPMGKKTILGRLLNDYKKSMRIDDLIGLLKQKLKETIK